MVLHTPKLVPAVIVNFGNFKRVVLANLGHFESKRVPGDQAEPKLHRRLLTNRPNQPGRPQ